MGGSTRLPETTQELRVIGPPGTGKTSFLTEVLNWEAGRYGPEQVVAVSHTRAAAAELAGRDTPLPASNVGTIHALAYRGLDRPELAEQPAYMKQFSEEHGYQTSASVDVTDLEVGLPLQFEGDQLLAQYSLCRNLEVPREVWLPSVTAFAKRWEQFKRETGTIDFTDMIELGIQCLPAPPGEPDVLVVDEAQDASRLQLRLIWQWASTTRETVFALDPDQAIYGFAGADPTVFLEYRPAKQKVLEDSYRVPRAVCELALRWIQQVSMREDVTYRPRDHDGDVIPFEYNWRQPEMIMESVREYLDAGKSVMIMASCAYMLEPMLNVLRDRGWPFGNRWRVKRGDWNPLARRGEKGTVQAIVDFLHPWQPYAQRLWTTEQFQTWTSVTKGLFRRGGKKAIAQLDPRATEDTIMGALVEWAKDEEVAAALMGMPPASIEFIQDHIVQSKASLGRYVCRVAREFGVEALTQYPQPLSIGTCHSFKGAEADVVIVYPDLSPQGFAGYQEEGTERDAVVRLFYVAMTRARETLLLGAPAGRECVEWL